MPAPSKIAILTYHSISNEPGPTSIPPTIFRGQMDAMAAAGVDVVDLDFVRRWLAGDETLARRTVAVTFDDAFEDFALNAHPALESHGFKSTVFAPTALIGGVESWEGANQPPRKLMDWAAIGDLSGRGVAFGSHTLTHKNLTRLTPNELRIELAASRRILEDKLGRPAPHFAPPYGHSNPRVRAAIAEHYDLSVGVGLGEARTSSPAYDLPRIEMHYYRDLARWRAFLDGVGALYLNVRKTARTVRQAMLGLSKSYH